jgi:tRNA dimethylallyltransferase
MDVAILGPTACGKTQLAVEVAQILGGQAVVGARAVAVSVDSVQVYKGLNIGAAKPSQEELAALPHELINMADPGEQYTAADYVRDVSHTLERLSSLKPQIFFVGGTGFYYQALQKGLWDVPAISSDVRDVLLERLESEGVAALHADLQTRDPVAAAKIHPNDRYRVLRALEIALEHGARPSELQNRPNGGPLADRKVLQIGLFMDRTVLRERVRMRLKKMLAAGWVDEVRQLHQLGYENWPALQSVGYKQVQMLLRSELSEDQLEQAIETATMQLAKRQMTWFRRDPAIEWFDVTHGLDAARTRILEALSL